MPTPFDATTNVVPAPKELAGPAVLALSLLAYLSAVLAGANGFVAASSASTSNQAAPSRTI